MADETQNRVTSPTTPVAPASRMAAPVSLVLLGAAQVERHHHRWCWAIALRWRRQRDMRRKNSQAGLVMKTSSSAIPAPQSAVDMLPNQTLVACTRQGSAMEPASVLMTTGAFDRLRARRVLCHRGDSVCRERRQSLLMFARASCTCRPGRRAAAAIGTPGRGSHVSLRRARS